MFKFNLISFLTVLTTVSAGLTDSLWGWNNHTKGALENLPRPRKIRGEIPSACDKNAQGKTFGYACPHMMMFSADMTLASQYDKLNNAFYYSVAGAAGDAECGMCFQIQPKFAEQQWNPKFRQLIVQVVNSGFDVKQGQFDLYMGAGGFGWYTACNSDCTKQYCNGGPCKEGMYKGNFSAWTNAKYYDSNLCYSGGIKWLNETTPAMCRALSGGENTLKNRMLYDSCMISNHRRYHQNFVSADSLRVQCPEGLYRLTGLRRADDAKFPKPWLGNKLTIKCEGNVNSASYCLTTMQDCCKKSCAWRNKVETHPSWRAVDTCFKNGSIVNYF
jgi:hypothetical protein